ncbi:SNARE domain-containing protein [Kalaharituber pfeilii]|nr:SNARE domain-containing protein [Kalaharituber pfeilii]
MMTSTADEDPFLQVQSDVAQALEQNRQSFSSYLRIRSTATSSDTPELLQAKSDLEATLAELSTDLSDLAESIRVVEVDPYKYGLEIDEVSRRRRFVKEVEGEVEDMLEELRKAAQRPIAQPKPSASSDRTPEANRADPDSYIMWEQEQQQVMLAEQDEVLDGVYRTVGNLREQAHEMGRELEEQVELLDAVDKDVTRIQDKLSNGMKRVAWVIKKNEDTASSCCIGFLIIILIILLILLLLV